MQWNDNSQRQLQPGELENPNQQMGQRLVWQPFAMGGGEWRTPQVVRLSDDDISRIAEAVVRKLEEQRGR